ncbi:olfactory receptor 1f45 isoform X1 [Oryctolagus cuniculus]|uniref:Olfactory receptor n=1 Tax=Oryctolagus cuniculus TaxID=9986 RepID=G1TAF4_RABIT|nr:olfactory receptor 1361 isoform X1 [Oryctolagus cuniculus]XP_051697284.1 olfactory receptor 1361 isoform X1 [Oryctolagus cuniculus]
MDGRNHTNINGFLLLGFSEHREQRLLLFGLFLGMYLVTVVGNLIIILAIRSDLHLHSPMYFFLANLSFSDIGFISTIVPKMLDNISSGTKLISYGGCLTQLYFFGLFADLDNFLLAVMALDRYVAISHPLHYTTTMNSRRCVLLVAGSWVITAFHALVHTLLVTRLSFCGPNIIPHFFCDLVPLLKLACSSTYVSDLVLTLVAGPLLIGPFLCILTSYFHIALAVLRIDSPKGKQKAFSNCTSHLSVVFLFYSTAIGVYLCPPSTYSDGKDRVFSVMYTVVTPMLNPFIYSLRNRDMKGALEKLLRRAPTLFLRPCKTQN